MLLLRKRPNLGAAEGTYTDKLKRIQSQKEYADSLQKYIEQEKEYRQKLRERENSDKNYLTGLPIKESHESRAPTKHQMKEGLLKQIQEREAYKQREFQRTEKAGNAFYPESRVNMTLMIEKKS